MKNGRIHFKLTSTRQLKALQLKVKMNYWKNGMIESHFSEKIKKQGGTMSKLE